ncbi:MAG: NAD(P)H-hydrate epimerase [Balneolaceae bacterium]
MDRYAIDVEEYPSLQLMETAGMQAARLLSKRFPDESFGRYFAGRGNNGGDALVVARYMVLHAGHRVEIWFPSGRKGLTPETDRNVKWLQKLAEQTSFVTIRDGLPESGAKSADYLVDGLIGTGLESDVRGEAVHAIEWINESGVPVIAMDIPSGLHADRGVPLGHAVRARLTCAFGARKTGFYLEQGPEYTGEVCLFPLSFSPDSVPFEATLIDPDQYARMPRPERTAHWKYEDDTVWVVGGSEGLTGATVTAVRAAWKTGIGSVHLVSPRGLMRAYETLLPESIRFPVGDSGDRIWNREHLEEVREIVNRREGVLLMGPGMGRAEPTLQFAGELLEIWKGSAVLDADALHVPGLRTKRSPEGKKEWILTPHPGELGVYAGERFVEGRDRLQRAQELADEGKRWILSKGEPTMVGVPGQSSWIAGYSSRMFARAGFGDLLSGTIAGEFARSRDAAHAVRYALLSIERQARTLYLKQGRYPAPGDLL